MPSNDPNLSTQESCEAARRINERRQQAIEERWLATYVLHIHLEIEAMIEEALRQTVPKPESFLD